MWWLSGPEGEETAGQSQEVPPTMDTAAMSEMKDQFDQQQQLIHQLKDLVRENEQQLRKKQNDLEESAAKLSKLKLQHKAKISQLSNQLQDVQKKSQTVATSAKNPTTSEYDCNVETATTVDTSRGKVLVLKRQLEENRAIFEKREKELSDSKHSIEQVLEDMQSQLEERDLIITQLKAGPSTKETIEPTKELETKDETTTLQEMYAQIVYKDSRMLELNNRILELEGNVMDLQENLKEKDQVIQARNKAIQLMTEDLSRRGKVVVDQLDDTRDEMRQMQHNFASLETQWKEEKLQLTAELELERAKLDAATAENETRVSELKNSVTKLESIRFDLSTRNAELQEKVIYLKESFEKAKRAKSTSLDAVPVDELQNELKKLRKEIEEKNVEIVEMQKQSESDAGPSKTVNQKILKLKAQHKSKVKSLENKIKELEVGETSNEQIVMLQNKIVELEEEKGNLQLKLVDFDDLVATQGRNTTEVEEFNEKLKQQSTDLSNHVKMISMLEKQKLDLVERLGEQDEKYRNMSEERQGLEEAKILLEMKLVEAEELKDIADNTCQELQKEMKVLKQQIDSSPDNNETEKMELRRTIDEMQRETDERKTEIESLRSLINKLEANAVELRDSLQDCGTERDKALKDCSNMENQLRSLSQQLLNEETNRKTLEEDLLESRRKYETEVSKNKDEIELLETMVKQRDYDTEELLKELHREVSQKEDLKDTLEATIEELKQTAAKNDEELKVLIDSQDTEGQQMRNKVTSLLDQLSEMESEVSSLQTKLQEEISINETLRSFVEEAEKRKVESEERHESDLQLVDSTMEELSKKDNETKKLEEEVEILREGIRQSENTIQELTVQLQDKANQHSDALTEIQSMDDKLRNIQLEIQTSEKRVTDLEEELRNKCLNHETLFRQSRDEANDLQNKLLQCTNQLESYNSEKQQLETQTQQLEEKLANEQLTKTQFQEMKLWSEQEAKRLREENSSFATMLATLLSDARNRVAESEQLKAELKMTKSKLRDQETVLHKLKIEKETFESEVTSRNGQNEDLRQELDAVRKQLQLVELEENEKLANLRAEFHANEETVLDLESKLANCLKENEEKEVEKNSLELELNSTKQQCVELRQKLEDTETEKTQHLSNLEDLKKELENQNSSLQDLRVHVSEVEFENSSLRQQQTELENKNTEMQNSLERLQMFESEFHKSIEVAERLQNELERLSEEAARLKEQNGRLMEYTQQLEADLTSTTEAMSKSDDQKENLIADLKEQLQEQSRTNTSSEESIEKLRNQTVELQLLLNKNQDTDAKLEDMEILDAKLKTIEEQKVELHLILDNKNQEIVELNAKLQEMENLDTKLKTVEVQKLQLEIEAKQFIVLQTGFNDKILELSTELDALSHEKASLEDKIANLERELNVTEDMYHGVESAMSDLNQEKVEQDQIVTRLNEEIELLRAEIAENTSELHSLKRSSEESESRFTIIQKENSELEVRVERLTEHIQSLATNSSDQVQDLSSKLESTNSELSQHIQHIADIEHQNQTLENELSKLREEIQLKESCIGDLNGQIHQMTSKLKNLDDQLLQMERHLHESKAELSDDVAKEQRIVEQLEEENEQLRNLVAEHSANEDKLKHADIEGNYQFEIERLESSLSKEVQKHATMYEENNILKQQLETAETKSSQLSEELMALKTEVQELEKLKLNLEEQLDVTRNDESNNSNQDVITRMQEEVDLHKKQMQECLKDVKVATEENQKLEQLLQEAEEKIKNYEVKSLSVSMEDKTPTKENLQLLGSSSETTAQSDQQQQLKNQLAVYKIKNEKMLSKLKLFKDKNDKVQLQINDLMSNQVSLEDETVRLRGINDRANEEIRRLSLEMRNLDRLRKTELQMLHDRLDTVEVANSNLIDTKEELDKRLTALMATNQELQKEKQTLEEMLSQMRNNDQSETLQTEKERLLRQLDSLKQHNGFLESDNLEFQQLLAKHQADKTKMEQDIRAQSERLVLLTQEHEKLKDELAAKPDSDVEELKENYRSLQKEYKELNNVRLQLEADVEGVQAELETAEAQKSRFESEVGNLRQQLENELQKTVQRADEKDTENALELSRLRNEELENQISTLREQLECVVLELQTSKQDLETTLENVKRQNVDLVKKVSDLEGELWKLEEEKEQLAEDVARRKEAVPNQKLMDDLEQMQQENENLLHRLADQRTDLKRLEDLKEHAETEARLVFQQQQETIKRLQAEMEHNRDKMIESNESHEEHATLLSEELSRVKSELGRTMLQLKEEMERVSLYESQNERLESELEQVKELCETRYEELQSLTVELRNLSDENSAMEQQLGNWKKHLGSVVNGNQTTDQQHIGFHQSDEERENARADVERIKAELQHSMHSLHLRDLRCEELTGEITKLIRERDSLQLRLSSSIRSDQQREMQIQLLERDLASRSPSASIASDDLEYDKDYTSDTDRAALFNRLRLIEKKHRELLQLNAVLEQTLINERENRHRVTADLKMANEELEAIGRGTISRTEDTRISVVAEETAPLLLEHSQTLVRSYTGAAWRIANWIQGRRQEES